MDPEYAKGKVKAEWVDEQSEPNNSGPIIMYLHGGNNNNDRIHSFKWH